MSQQTIPLDYANSLMYELEKAFWDERGKGARFRMTKVGNQYFEIHHMQEDLFVIESFDSLLRGFQEYCMRHSLI